MMALSFVACSNGGGAGGSTASDPADVTAAASAEEATTTSSGASVATPGSEATATPPQRATTTTAAASTSTSQPPTTTTPSAPPPPPAVAERFDAALADRTVRALGTPTPDHVRDSVARLWLLVDDELRFARLRGPVRAVTAGRQELEDIAAWHLASPERSVPLAGRGGARFVDGLYRTILGRRPGAEEVVLRAAQLRQEGWSPARLAVELAESDEAVERTGTTAPGPATVRAVAGVTRGVSDSVLRLHLGLLRRFPMTEELDGRVARYLDGESLTSLAGEVLESDEYAARRPPGGPEAFVAGLYQDVLGRDADPAGLAGWVGQLGAGVSPGVVAVGLTESDEAVARTYTADPVVPRQPAPPPSPATDALPEDVPDDAAPPPAAPPVPGSGVLAIGDSVMLGAAGALQSAIPGISVDASVSRQFSDGASIVQSLASSGSLPGTLVVHLGTNGYISSGDCDALMSAASGASVVLVTVSVPREWESSVNSEISGCASRNGAAVADWNAVAGGVVGDDGYHVGAEGASVYANLIAASI